MSLRIFVFITFSVLGSIVSSVFVFCNICTGNLFGKMEQKKVYPKHSTYYYNLPNDSLLTMKNLLFIFKNLNLGPIGHLEKSLNHIVVKGVKGQAKYLGIPMFYFSVLIINFDPKIQMSLDL